MPNPFSDGSATLRATIRVGTIPRPLPPTVTDNIRRVVVDSNLHLPSMFEITFADDDGTVLRKAGLQVGTPVQVLGPSVGLASFLPKSLISGEITAVEAICEDMSVLTVVRGFEKTHRMQRARKTRVFRHLKDSMIAVQIARQAKLLIGEIDDTRIVHRHMPQFDQTDWDFLQYRAAENGFEVGVHNGKFFFRKPSGASPFGGLLSRVEAATGLGDGSTLVFKDNLLSFRPSLTSANLTSSVQVRAWDPEQAEEVVATAPVKTSSARLSATPASLAAAAGGGGALGSVLGAVPDPTGGLASSALSGLAGKAPGGLGKALGKLSAGEHYVIMDRPLGEGSAATTAANRLAASLADSVGGTFAEAEGYAVGNPSIRPGNAVTVSKVPKHFAGSWTVTNACHVFDDSEGGYHTRFWVSGRQDRSLLGLTAMGTGYGRPPRIPGLVCGIVTANDESKELDPMRTSVPVAWGRVKVSLPWVASDYVTDWARVVQVGAGADSGALFMPEVGDEVLVGFEYGDIRRPYVLGGLINKKTEYHSKGLGGPAVPPSAFGSTVRRGLVSPTGNKLVFTDDRPPEGPALTSKVELGTGPSMGLVVNQTESTISLICNPTPSKHGGKTRSTVVVASAKTGTVTIQGGDIVLEGSKSIALNAPEINVNAKAALNINGAKVNIEAKGMLTAKAPTIMLNS